MNLFCHFRPLPVIAALLLAALPAVDAFAADADKTGLELGIGAAWHHWTPRDELGQLWDGNSLVSGFGPVLRVGYRFLPWLGIEAEGVLLPTKGRDDSIAVLAAGVRGHAVAFWNLGDWQPFALIGAGSSLAAPAAGSRISTDQDTIADAGIGLQYAITRALSARADLRGLLLPAVNDGALRVATEFEGQLSIVWRPMAGSVRADEPRDGPVSSDADNDGIPDDEDVCPYEAETINGVRDADGCPELGVETTTAPSPKAGLSVESTATSAALPEPERLTDPDGDGLFGDEDLCPNVAEDKDGFADGDGCPDTDNDGDGIPDTADKCPLAAETANGYEDGDGCPDELPAQLAKFTGRIAGIQFQPNQDVIAKSSDKVLLGTVKVLRETPAVRLRIEGHTDASGDAEKNTELSQHRADAVRKWLIAKGIDAARLEAKGFGPSAPIADNATAAGRAQNRRVEFHLIHDNAAPDAGGTSK